MTERFPIDVDGERLTAVVHRPKSPIGATLLLGHGASGGQRESFIREWAEGLAARGLLVVTYDFPFVEHGRRKPDPDEVLQACCRAAAVAAKQCRPKNRLFIGGKSLGGRVAAEVAAAGGEEMEDVAGVVVLGYPLHPIGKHGASRARHLEGLRVPVLVVQGTRDPFGTAAELEREIDGLPEGSEVHPVEGGDHSFSVPPHGDVTQARVEDEVQNEIVRWISDIASRTPATGMRARPRPATSRARAQMRALRRSTIS
jgi:hypothetical protein